MDKILVDGKLMEVSRFTSTELHGKWDAIEKRMGEVDGIDWSFGRQSEYLMQAVDNKLISREDALELYLVSINLKTVL